MSNDLTLSRVIAAPRASVWSAWTQPELIAKWFVPRPHFVTDVVIEPRAGGAFSMQMHVDGNQFPNNGVILEVIEGEKLVFSDHFAPGWIPNPTPFMAAIITLKDHPEGTQYDALVRHSSPEQVARHLEMNFHEGWGIMTDQLAEVAASL
ncbi:MAG: SRPBCC family protein [Paracoccaceae bacterium]